MAIESTANTENDINNTKKHKITDEIKLAYQGDFDIHHLHLHNYITQQELTLHLRLDKKMSNENCHNIATVVEKMILEKFDMVATIHVEPLE